MATIENGCEAIGGGCFWAEFWKSYEPLANFLAHDGFRNGALVVAAIVTLIVAIWRAQIADEDKKTSIKQADTSEAGLNIDRFQKGAAMLGDERLSVRQAGLLMLSELAQQNMREYFDITQKIICSFIKDRSREQKAVFASSQDPMFELREFEDPISQDNQTAMEELSKLNELHWSQITFDNNRAKIKVSITEANFRQANFNAMDLRFIDFSGSDFTSAYLNNANLSYCDLRRAIFLDANLWDSKLKNADLLWSKFTDPNDKNFWMTDLTSQQLHEAKFVQKEFLAKLEAYEQAEAAKASDKNFPT